MPTEKSHTKAKDIYLKVNFSEIKKLPTPILNIIPRRISFGFTTLAALRSAPDILALFDVYPGEQILLQELRKKGIAAIPEYGIAHQKKRYRIDLVIVCAKGMIAIECDNYKAHSGKIQLEKDTAKDVLLRKKGFTVIRIKEKDMMTDLPVCLS